MKLANALKRLIGRRTHSETRRMRSIVLMLRREHRPTVEELRAAGERGWGRRFNGDEDLLDMLYFVFSDHPAQAVVKAGPHVIRVTSVPARYIRDDRFSLSRLPQPEQRKAWTEHHACILLELYNDRASRPQNIPDEEAYAALARLALQLGDPNCCAVLLPIRKIMMPNDGAAEQGLRMLIDRRLPMSR